MQRARFERAWRSAAGRTGSGARVPGCKRQLHLSQASDWSFQRSVPQLSSVENGHNDSGEVTMMVYVKIA